MPGQHGLRLAGAFDDPRSRARVPRHAGRRRSIRSVSVPGSNGARRDGRGAWPGAALLGAALAVGAPFGLPFSTGVPGALRVLDGQFPYRDFWTIYAPGQYWLLAFLFRCFGAQLLVAALASVALLAAAAALFFVV